MPQVTAPVWPSVTISAVSVCPGRCLSSFSRRSGGIAVKFAGEKNIFVQEAACSNYSDLLKTLILAFHFEKANWSNSFYERKAEGTVRCT